MTKRLLIYTTEIFLTSHGHINMSIASISQQYITKHSSALYIGMAKVLPIIDELGYDGQNSSFSSSPPPPRSDSTPITQKESHIST